MAWMEKPYWLEGALSHLNWDIFTWHIYVGDTIESAIDWVIDWFNTLAEWAAMVGAWWEDFRQEVVDGFNIFREKIALFLDDPISYLINVFADYILPWAEVHVPFIATLYHWFSTFKAEIELFFEGPVEYLKTKFNDDILPWAQEHIPFIATLYHWFTDFRAQLELFFESPVDYLKTVFADYILPWAQQTIPFIATLFFWYTEFGEKIVNFFTTEFWDDVVKFFNDPVEWVYDRLDEFFERFW